MKSSDHTTESLLESGKDISLTKEERSLMKSELLSYAHFHTANQTPQRPKRSWQFMYAGVVATLVLMIGVGTGVASTESMPGEALYGMKVEVVEPLIGLTQFSEYERLNYQVSLMERRLDEVQELSRAQRLTTDEVEVVDDLVARHTTSIDTILEADTDSSIPAEVSLTIVSDLVAVVEAHEEIIEQISGVVDDEHFFEDEQRVLMERYTEELDDLDQEATPGEKREVIRDMLTEIEVGFVEGYLHALTSTQEISHSYLGSIEEVLEAEDYRMVIEQIGGVLQDLEVATHVREASSTINAARTEG